MSLDRLDTYCGLYCGSCEVRLAKTRGGLENLAKAWGQEVNDLLCNGCKSDRVSVYCRKCQIKSCAESQAADYCYQCSDFPCQKIIEFQSDDRPHHSVVLHNLDIMRDKGVNTWLQQQKTRWSCRRCNEEYSWYDTKCSKCGEPVKSCLDDEKDLAS